MDLINLPTDPSDLQRLVLRQAAALARSRAALAEVEADKARVEADKANLEAELKDVKARMDALIRRVFGRRSERLPANQIQLFDPTVLPEVEAAVDTDQTDDKPPGPRRRKKRTGGRRALPGHLERIEVTSAETAPAECEECGDPVRAGIALATIRKLFRVEREVQPLTSEVRAQTRRLCIATLLARFRDQLNQWSTTCRPKSAMGKAITYARNPQPTLVVFLDDGTAPPHNNTSERLLRSPLLGLLPEAKLSRVWELTPQRWAERFAETAG